MKDDGKVVDVQSPEHHKMDLNISREFTGVDYVSIESVIRYNEKYDFEGVDHSALNDSKINTFNHAALSTWYQLENRPDFLDAFKALVQVKQLYTLSDPYFRYLTVNCFNLAFHDITLIDKSVLLNLSDDSKKAIYEDEDYGMNETSKLYNWIKAMNNGPSSEIYKEILDHYQTELKLPDFT